MGMFLTARAILTRPPRARQDAPSPIASTAKQNLFDPEPLQLILATG